MFSVCAHKAETQAFTQNQYKDSINYNNNNNLQLLSCKNLT